MEQADEETSRTEEDMTEECRDLSILSTPNSPGVSRVPQVPVLSVLVMAPL